MVLILPRQVRPVLALCLLLNACTHLQPTQDDNRIPESKVIPASVEQPVRIDSSQPASPSSPKETIPKTEKEIQTPPSNPGNTGSATAAPKKTEVLDSILLQASKAIDNGQWLRAQHHLEHALRIAPQHAQTFYL